MRSWATDLIRLIISLLLLLGSCLVALAQDYKCNVPEGTVTCEKGQQCHGIPKGDGTWNVECVTVPPVKKTADQSSREQQGAMPPKINSSYSATTRFLASSPYGNWMFYCYPSANIGGLVDSRKEEAERRRKVQEEPNKLENHFLFGQSLLYNDKLVEAEKEFLFVLQQEPPSVQSFAHWSGSALKGLGVVLFEQGRYAEAQNTFQTNLELTVAYQKALQRSVNPNVVFPLDSCSLYMLALTQAAQQNYKDAEANLRGSTLGDAPSSYTLLGSVLFDQGKFPDAENAFREALTFLDHISSDTRLHYHEAPLRIAAQEGLVAALLKQRKYVDAETSTEQLGHGRDEAWLIFRTGVSLLKQGKYTDAERSFNGAIALDPTNVIFKEALKISKLEK